MILLDTHVWVWWVHRHPKLSIDQRIHLQALQPEGLGVSVISCWEVAKLHQLQRLTLPLPIAEWFGLALSAPGIVQIPLTPRIALESTQLPGDFHRDPADQILVATSRLLSLPLATLDGQILKYPHLPILRWGSAT